MDKDILKGKWKDLKGKVQQKWGKLTDEDLARMQGSYEELEGTLQRKYGYEKDKIRKEIDSFFHENHIERK